VSTRTFRAERARYASLTRSRTPDDPELIASRQLMLEQAFIDAIDRALSKAPPMTPDVRERIVGLLSCHPGGGAS
jgi:hypothetical protein